MGKMPASCAVLAVAVLLALPASATAAEPGVLEPGVLEPSVLEPSVAGASKADPIEISSARRQRRIVRQYWVPRRIGQPYTYGPYHEGYSHDPYGRRTPGRITGPERTSASHPAWASASAGSDCSPTFDVAASAADAADRRKPCNLGERYAFIRRAALEKEQ